MSSKPFTYRVDPDTLAAHGINPNFWKGYRQRILNHHKRMPWNTDKHLRPEKVKLTFAHHLIFNVLTGNDIFKGVTGKCEKEYFLSILSGDNAIAHPFQKHYYTVEYIHRFLLQATTDVKWYDIDKWRFEQFATLEQKLLGVFNHHYVPSRNTFSKSTYMFLDNQFTIIYKKFKKSLDNIHQDRV